MKGKSLVQDPAELYQAFCNIVPLRSPTKQGLIPMYTDSYRIAPIPHVECFLLVEGQEANDRACEGCFGPDRSYQRCSVMRPHGPDLIEFHPPTWAPTAADGFHWSCAMERNWEFVLQVFHNRATMALLHNKRRIPHIDNSPQMLAWFMPNLSQNIHQNPSVRFSVHEEKQQRAPEDMTRVHMRSNWS